MSAAASAALGLSTTTIEKKKVSKVSSSAEDSNENIKYFVSLKLINAQILKKIKKLRQLKKGKTCQGGERARARASFFKIPRWAAG